MLNNWDFLVYIIIFGVIIFTDWRFHKIFNWNIVVGIAFALFVAIKDGHVLNSLIGGIVGVSLMFYALAAPSIVALAVKLLGIKIKIKTDGELIGGGDFKIAPLMGLVVGVPLIFWALAGAMIAGGTAAAVILLTKRPVKDLPLGVPMSIFTIGVLAVLAS